MECSGVNLKKNNTLRHKRLNREGRLRAAKLWLRTYNGKNIVKQNITPFYSDYWGDMGLRMIETSNFVKEIQTRFEMEATEWT
ncbi:hypothetical protein DET54_12561 [Paenibacillus pabuli]|uniref:Uncharacterized protein n=1 Tax=Paenibacillus pabuli TaxID=1472 RepID=A0ABX9BBK8_9BACL|nr:hypothetical protein DET54_12561 [Paenibacillus pabuli]